MKMKNRWLSMVALALLTINASAQESDLFLHKRINIYDIATMPNAKGTEHTDSFARNRIWRAEQPRLYEYLPGLEERRRAAVIVIPGGGYVKQAYETAGVSLAKWLNTMGVTAFVLLHRLPNQPDLNDPAIAPVMDAQRAVKWVRAHADDYGIDPDKIGLMGCSAGAHISACVNVAKQDYSLCGDDIDTVSCRPNFAVLVSPAGKVEGVGSSPRNMGGEIQRLMDLFPLNTMVDASTAPMLMIHASNDRTVSPLNSVELYKALYQAGVKQSSLHMFPFGAHSISLRSQPGSTQYWPTIAEEWMRELGMLD